MRTFVIGDTHGHLDRLLALLVKSGAVTLENPFVGSGELIRKKPDVEIVQLGDLGQFDRTSKRGDHGCYVLAKTLPIRVLWGNHDHAVVSSHSAFRGYDPPDNKTKDLLYEVKPQWAYSAHGYLMTHAGVSPIFAPLLGTTDPTEIAAGLNAQKYPSSLYTSIGRDRGGFDPSGGIIWRDDRTPLWEDVPQIYGHTRQANITRHNKSWCIDIGNINDGNLVGIWLPEMRVVAVGPDAEIFEAMSDV